MNSCSLAVFIMGFNLGLTVLLTLLVAEHSPDSALDSPQMPQSSSFLRNSALSPSLDIHPTKPISRLEREGPPAGISLFIDDPPSPSLTATEEGRRVQSNQLARPPCTKIESKEAAASIAVNSTGAKEEFQAQPSSPPRLLPPQPLPHAAAAAAATTLTTTGPPSHASLAAGRSAAEESCRRGRCKVYYVHVHKSGGTTLCAIAGANGLRVNLATNCLQKADGKPVPFWKWPSSQQRTWLLGRQQDFIANEGGEFDVNSAPPPQGATTLNAASPLLSGGAGAGDSSSGSGISSSSSSGGSGGIIPGGGSHGMGLVYVLTVRNPLDRVLSHFRHERASPKASALKSMSFAAFVNQTEFVHWKGDFYVRLLGGCGWELQCQRLPHLEHALEALHFFSAVLVTDDPSTFSLGARVLLARRLGWDPKKADTDGKRRGTHVDSRSSVELANDPAAFARLADLNSLDLAFHARAAETFHKQVVDVLSQTLAVDPPPSPPALPLLSLQKSSADLPAVTELERAREEGGKEEGKGSAAVASEEEEEKEALAVVTPSVAALDAVLSSGSGGSRSSGSGSQGGLGPGAGISGSASSTGSDTATAGASDVQLQQLLARFLPSEFDRSGFGGHTELCKGVGGMDINECRKRLIELASSSPSSSFSSTRSSMSSKLCDALSFKDGQCYLHRTKGSPDFYTDVSMGHQFQQLKPSL